MHTRLLIILIMALTVLGGGWGVDEAQAATCCGTTIDEQACDTDATDGSTSEDICMVTGGGAFIDCYLDRIGTTSSSGGTLNARMVSGRFELSGQDWNGNDFCRLKSMPSNNLTIRMFGSSKDDTFDLDDATYLLIKDVDLELVGLYGAEATLLDGTGEGQVVLFTQGDLVLSGLTITGGAVESGTGYGGGVYVRQGNVEIRDAVLSGNEAWRGGGLYLYWGDATVESSIIQGNTAWEDGGGMGVDFGDLLVSDSTISGNTSGDKGGGLHVYEGELTLENSRLYRNSATGKGGGAAVHEGLLSVSGSTLLENLAYGGGGVSVDTGDLEVLESTFESNTTTDARGSGGGAYLRTGDAVIEGSTFQSNKTGASGYGGGVYLDEGTASISTSTFSAITAGFAGGGVNVEDGTIYMEYSLFEENTAGVGGGVFVETGTLSCTGSSSVTAGFERNQATYFGGGVAIYLQPELDSVACDWGTGTNDNWPDDLTLGEDDVLEVSGLGDDETFTCDAKGCE